MHRRWLLLAASISASTAVEVLHAWESPGSTYYADAELPGDPSECCGSQLTGDPAYGVDSQICECDLTAGECDAACCCDQDCSEFETMTVFACSSNATRSARAGVKMCSEDLVRTNLPQSATAAGWETETDLDGLLCVVHDNSASLGSFLTDPTASGGPLSEEEVRTELERYGVPSYDECVVGRDAYCEQAASGMAYSGTGDHYSYAQPLLGDGCLTAGSMAGCGRKRPVVLPAASPDGVCGGRQQDLGYLVDVPPFSCRLHLSAATLPQLCATSLNASFLQQQLLAATPAATPLLAPQLFLRQGERAAVPPNFTAVATPPLSSYDPDNFTCSNALVGLEYLYRVTGRTGSLSSVAAYLSLASLSAPDPALGPAPALADPRATSGDLGPISAAFLDASDPSGRRLSGRPGYVRGKPVLVADYPPDGGDTELQLRRRGLSLLGVGARGECDAAAAGTELLFGEGLDASCTTSLSYAQLPAFCEMPSAGPAALAALARLRLDWGSSTAALHFGVYGDAHPAAADDWVGVSLQLPSTGLTLSYDAGGGACSNVLAGIHVRLLVAEVGSAVTPISRILGAQIVLTTQTVVARRCALGVPCDTQVVTRATSEFVAVPGDGRTFDFVPPMPTIIPALPDEVFYPFYLHSAAPSARGELAPLALLASLATCALLLAPSHWR